MERKALIQICNELLKVATKKDGEVFVSPLLRGEVSVEEAVEKSLTMYPWLFRQMTVQHCENCANVSECKNCKGVQMVFAFKGILNAANIVYVETGRNCKEII